MFSSPRLLRLGNELRALLSLATPIIIAQLAYTSIGFVDTVMSGHFSARDLAAVALGNSIWIPLFLLMTGILLATTAKVAQRFGAGKLDEIATLVRQALWLALVVGSLAGAVLWHAEYALQLMQVDAALIEPTMGYLHGVALGFPCMALYHVLRCYSDGLGHTKPSMMFGLFGLLLNIPLNYVLIYGKLGLPALGSVGCGWASALVMLAMLLAMRWWIGHAPFYAPTTPLGQFEMPRWSVIQRLLAIGLPIGISVFAESSIFAVIALLIGSLGATVVAGHQIALNFSSLVFMIPYSIGMAATVRIGQTLGRGEPRDARFAAGVSMAAALGYACLSASCMLLLKDQIAAIYSSTPEVVALAASLIVYAALFQFSDAVQVTAAGALRGYQDTRATMLITLFAYWGIGLPVGYLLGLSDIWGQASGPAGLWQGLIAGLTGAALMLLLRLRKSARHSIYRQASSAA